jgi:alpha-L-arabinofuranosidase
MAPADALSLEDDGGRYRATEDHRQPLERRVPDYFQSFGLGFYGFFQLAEDIGARPLPVLNCGMACQFNSSETVTFKTRST